MDAEQILADARGHGAEVVVEDGDLVLYSGEKLPTDIRAALKAHKAELVSHIAANDLPLAAKLREAGCPFGLEVDGEIVAWLVSDEDAVRRTDLNPRFTAAEAEVLAQFDERGIRDLARLKAAFGGTLGPNDVARP